MKWTIKVYNIGQKTESTRERFIDVEVCWLASIQVGLKEAVMLSNELVAVQKAKEFLD
jgi:hypothetical protein